MESFSRLKAQADAMAEANFKAEAKRRGYVPSAQADRYRAVLDKIANPIAWLRSEAEAKDERFEGAYAVQLANDANWLRCLAGDALKGSEV